MRSVGQEDGAVETEAKKAEKDGNERFEISDTSKPAEAGGRSIAELEGGWQAPEVDGSGHRAAG